MATHVMIDIETLGTGSNAVLLSLGAVKFDPTGDIYADGGKDLDTFYVAIDPQSCVAAKLQLSVSTIMWWMQPDRAEARDKMLSEERHDLFTALSGFTSWYGDKSLPTWGNGATFDNVIVRSAFEAIGHEPPWKFFDDRCYRTLKNLRPDIKLTRMGVFHNALDDALSQAGHLQRLWYALDLDTVPA